MEGLRALFRLDTVRKKVLLLSKVVGIIIALAYLASKNSQLDSSLSSLILLVPLIVAILGVDFYLGRVISDPLTKLNETAAQMAALDLSAQCSIETKDEFGELCGNLNHMFGKLKETLEDLETTNHQLEAEIKRKHLLLEQSKELVDHLSHEMKTPLGIIHAYTEALQEAKSEEKKEEYREVILSATERMNAMLVSLLDLSSLEAGIRSASDESLEFVELVETVAGRILLDLEDEELFSYELPEERIYLKVNKHRMEQVISNLISNAKEHREPGSRIHLRVEDREDEVFFSIFNQAPGISPEEVEQLWTKFYRGKKQINPRYAG